MVGSIGPFIHRKIIVLREGASVYSAARAMCDKNVGSVVVSDGDGHMVGILTDRDLTCAMATDGLNSNAELSEIMTPSPATVSETATLDDVIKLMKTHGVRRIPVIHKAKSGESERCIGMVSLDDLVVAKLINLKDLSEIVRSQVFRRRKSSPQWTDEEIQSIPAKQKFFMEFNSRTGLNEQQTLSFVELVAGLIVRRLHFTSAASLISFLPPQLRSELLDLPAGPDRSITGDRIIKEVSSRFDVSEQEAKNRIQALWASFALVVPEGFEAEIADEIPDDIRIHLVPLSLGTSSGKAFSNVEQNKKI